MDITDKILKEIKTLNEFGKYNLFEKLLNENVIDIQEIIAQYAKIKQHELVVLKDELSKAYLHIGLSETARMNFLKSRKIIE